MGVGVIAKKLSKLIGARGVKRLGGTTTPLPPKGYVPICVGFNNDTRRFIVHTKAFGEAEFLQLLYRSAEEYGFHNEGILRIAYEARDFEEWMITRAKGKAVPVKSV
ncbi:auxin-responsive protein SAUR71-like [Populus nigra]|uniref:auxin-responsive protein SAUR71-like n=1 Tax=Populus nigra TaxID=3691 RepID=UPI002B2714A7|nr:auxin-responsive protein SAUR71-like [Populus nigra]